MPAAAWTQLRCWFEMRVDALAGGEMPEAQVVSFDGLVFAAGLSSTAQE